MPNPPLIYLNDEGPAFWFLNNLVTIKATTESTAGAYSLNHHLLAPTASTPYHLHKNEDEAFYVLDGLFTFFVNGEKTTVGPGGYVYGPRNVPHGFRNESGRPATVLVLAMPGDSFTNFVMEMGEPATERTLPTPTMPNMQKLAALATKYEMEIFGPLPD
jgi:quercetin dioxygenase-like cupin family protein